MRSPPTARLERSARRRAARRSPSGGPYNGAEVRRRPVQHRSPSGGPYAPERQWQRVTREHREHREGSAERFPLRAGRPCSRGVSDAGMGTPPAGGGRPGGGRSGTVRTERPSLRAGAEQESSRSRAGTGREPGGGRGSMRGCGANRKGHCPFGHSPWCTWRVR